MKEGDVCKHVIAIVVVVVVAVAAVVAVAVTVTVISISSSSSCCSSSSSCSSSCDSNLYYCCCWRRGWTGPCPAYPSYPPICAPEHPCCAPSSLLTGVRGSRVTVVEVRGSRVVGWWR